MSYAISLNLADSIRFEKATKELGMEGESLVNFLMTSFFGRKGVNKYQPDERQARSSRAGRRHPAKEKKTAEIVSLMHCGCKYLFTPEEVHGLCRRLQRTTAKRKQHA